MGYKFVSEENSWVAWYCERHPITKMPKTFRRKGLKSEAEAKRVERELVVKVREYFSEKILPTWPKLAHEFMEAKLAFDWTNKTYQNCRICLEAHTLGPWKSHRIDKITPMDIKRLLDERVGHTSVSNQQTLLKFIRGAFQYAVDNGYLSKNPAPNIRFKIGEKIKKVLTEQQSKLLLEKAKEYDSPWYYHWALALYTGMRNGELYALSWDKVNFENRTILVDSSWNKVDEFKDTKSGDDRMVEIAPTLVTVLKELKLKQYDSHFVLPRSRNWEKGEQARMLRMFLQGIGLPEVRFHDLRATWATIMLSKGVEPIKVMSMGGWKNLKTMQIYIRKAGINIKGITDTLELHDPTSKTGEVLSLLTRRRSD